MTSYDGRAQMNPHVLDRWANRHVRGRTPRHSLARKTRMGDVSPSKQRIRQLSEKLSGLQRGLEEEKQVRGPAQRALPGGH